MVANPRGHYAPKSDLNALAAFIGTDGQMAPYEGYQPPDWFLYIQAAKTLGCDVTELVNKPVSWVHWAMAFQQVKGMVQQAEERRSNRSR